MKAVLFIYKKEDTILVYDLELSLKKHKTLISAGYEHISTIDAAIVLQNIVDTIQDDLPNAIKVTRINEIITK